MQIAVNFPCELLEQHTEKRGKQRSSKIQALLAKVITIVELTALKSGKRETVDHVPEEEGLLGLETFRY